MTYVTSINLFLRYSKRKNMGENVVVNESKKQLLGKLIGLARATEGNEHKLTDSITDLLLEGLFISHSRSRISQYDLLDLLNRIEEEKKKLIPDCYQCVEPCGKNNDFDLNDVLEAGLDMRSLKTTLLFGLQDIAVCLYQKEDLDYKKDTIRMFLCKALYSIGMEAWGVEELLPSIMEMGEIKLKCMGII